MSDEKSSPPPIKFGRSNTMTLTQSGWKISIKNADGTSDEVTLEPKLPEATVASVEDVEKDGGDDRDAEHDSTPSKPSVALRIYLFIQYFLNTSLAIIIIAIMALTLAKYNATKNVPGAWPQNPVLSPTLLMMIVSIVNCLVDSASLLVQCCGARALGVMAGIVSKVHKVTGVVMALAPAAAVGFSGISTTSSNNSDLWSWSCSSGADQMAQVNSSDTICTTNQTAFALQICQIIFHLLSVLIPVFAGYRPNSPSSKDSKGSKSAKDETNTATNSGDEAAQNLIDEAGATFQSEQTWGMGAAGLPKKSG